MVILLEGSGKAVIINALIIRIIPIPPGKQPNLLKEKKNSRVLRGCYGEGLGRFLVFRYTARSPCVSFSSYFSGLDRLPLDRDVKGHEFNERLPFNFVLRHLSNDRDARHNLILHFSIIIYRSNTSYAPNLKGSKASYKLHLLSYNIINNSNIILILVI